MLSKYSPQWQRLYCKDKHNFQSNQNFPENYPKPLFFDSEKWKSQAPLPFGLLWGYTIIRWALRYFLIKGILCPVVNT